MKRVIPLLVGLCVSTPVFATNGDNMIAAGSISRAMGGTGIAHGMGAESILKNPALMSSTKEKFELSFGGMLFKPEVKATVATNSATSDADSFVIPAVGFTYRVCEKLIFGIGAYGVSGLGVDYRDETNISKMSTALNLMKFTPAISYQMGNFSFGFGASILYGTLGISYFDGTKDIGRGVSDDLGFGFDVGVSYEIANFTMGINYQSAIEMQYKHQIANAATNFRMTDVTTDLMEQPAEYGVGISYRWNKLDMTFDYKVIAWSEASGYKEFGWDDQNVMALGAAYHLNGTTLRAGYNHAKNPLKERAISNPTTGVRNAVNFFNNIGFPATAENHYTFGASHQFTKIFGMDFSYVYSPEVESVSTYNGGMGEMPIKSTHKESSLSLAGRWIF